MSLDGFIAHHDHTVGVAAGTITRQCLQAGLLDEVAVDLIPLVLGTGRPYFGELTDGRPALSTTR